MTQIFQTNITVMQDADGAKEIFTVPTENGKKVLTMAEYIERKDLLELYRMDDPVLNKNGHVPLPVIRQNIMDIPAADVAQVRHGRWILEREPNGKPYCFHCSVCDSDCHCIGIVVASDYCPNCGAKMDGGATCGLNAESMKN